MNPVVYSICGEKIDCMNYVTFLHGPTKYVKIITTDINFNQPKIQILHLWMTKIM